MSSPTETATAGTYQSFAEDFIHYVGPGGSMRAYIDFNGALYCSDCVADGVSVKALQTQIQNNLPSDIDLGSF